MTARYELGYGWTTNDPAYDTRRVYFGIPDYHDTEVFYLPHQCDEWIIGNAEQARELITDLETLLETS